VCRAWALYLSMLLRASNGLHDTYIMHTIFSPRLLQAIYVYESWNQRTRPSGASLFQWHHFNDPYADVGYYHRSYNLQFRGPQDRTLPYLLFICDALLSCIEQMLQTAVITNSKVVSGLRLVARGWDGNALLWHASFLGFIFPPFCLLILIDCI